MAQILTSRGNMLGSLLALLMLGFTGCYPFVQVQLENKRAEAVLFSMTRRSSDRGDSLLTARISGQDTAGTAVYRLAPGESVRLYRAPGRELTTANLLIDTLRIYAGKDTLTFDNKQDIINRLVEKRRRDFYLEIN